MLKIINLLVTVLKRVGKIALFDKALVVALARGACKCAAMWVGFLSSFLRGEEKNKINFHQICTVLSKS